MDYNDHTDSEIARREAAYEMGAETHAEQAWDRWCRTVEESLISMGITTKEQGLDGDQNEDGFSLDFASDDFDDGMSPIQYVAKVLSRRTEMGL